MMVPIENHGARATCKGTFVVQQISLLKLQTCIHYDFGPRQCLAMPVSSFLKLVGCSLPYHRVILVYHSTVQRQAITATSVLGSPVQALVAGAYSCWWWTAGKPKQFSSRESYSISSSHPYYYPASSSIRCLHHTRDRWAGSEQGPITVASAPW